MMDLIRKRLNTQQTNMGPYFQTLTIRCRFVCLTLFFFIEFVSAVCKSISIGE